VVEAGPLSFALRQWQTGLMPKRMRLFSGDWRLVDTAPLNQDVRGEPYPIPYPCKLTAAGWVSSGKETPLAVTPLQWRPYVPRKR
jgi:hypothetical protein